MKISSSPIVKYCIKYHDMVFHAERLIHKKTGAFSYGRHVGRSVEWDWVELMLFDTEFQAKQWIILRSSMPKAEVFLLSITSEMADKIIATGKYKLSKAYFSDNLEAPLLCELVIDEYVV